jgi:hypothetical protein
MIVAAVWSAALAGGILGVSALSERDAPAPVTRHVGAQFNAPRLGGRVTTSFGSLTVSSVVELVGPTRRMHLTRAPRGMHPIQLNLTINNLQRRGVPYKTDWFRLVGTRGSSPIGWSSHGGTLRPLAAKALLLRAFVPVGDRLPRLEFRDPEGRAPVFIDLGSDKGLQFFNPSTHRHGG